MEKAGDGEVGGGRWTVTLRREGYSRWRCRASRTRVLRGDGSVNVSLLDETGRNAWRALETVECALQSRRKEREEHAVLY